jgi:hypothetical protein
MQAVPPKMDMPSQSTNVEVVPPPELWADALAVDVLVVVPPELDEDEKLEADADADAEEPPLAVALAEELAEDFADWASAPLALNVRTSKRQGNTDLLRILIMGNSLLSEHSQLNHYTIAILLGM